MQTQAVHIGTLGTHKLWMSSVDAKKRESLKELSQSDGYHKEFYVRATVRAARTRAAHLLLRMFPGHSRCALTASPAQRVQYSSVPSVLHCIVESGTKPLHMKREPK